MRTIIELFETAVDNFPDNPYLWEKKDGKFIETTYRQTREHVLKLAAGLVSIGMKKGDRAGLISDGRNDWIISELGILYAGGVNVPLSIRLQENELIFRLNHSGSKYILFPVNTKPKLKKSERNFPNWKKLYTSMAKTSPGKMMWITGS
jgi:long-chain acyl-CoA synthetase